MLDPFDCDFDEELSDALETLWKDPAIEEAFMHKDERNIPDHMDFFFDKINELSKNDYIPTDEDIMKARIRTIGVSTVTLNVNNTLLKIYDVGGQKNERFKSA